MKKIPKYLKLLFFIIIVLFIIFGSISSNKIPMYQMLLFCLIGMISILEILLETKRKAFSLNLMHWLFILFFYFIAPVIQLMLNYHPWGIVSSKADINLTCIIILLWCLFYKIGNYFARKKQFNFNGKKKKRINVSIITVFILTLLSIGSAIIIIRNVGLGNLFSRGTSSFVFEGNNSQMNSLITSHCTKAIIVFSLVVSAIKYQKDKRGLVFLITNAIILLLTCFPTALARNTAGIIYMGAIVILYYKNFNKIKGTIKYPLIFIVAFIILFPAINAFRKVEFSQVNIKETLIDVVDNISSNYLSGDYDAFSMITNTKNYVSHNGTTMGKQLFGSLLFFIPRSIWESKPVGSGSMIFGSLGHNFTNVSCPLIAEGFINFGYLGIVLFAILSGFVCSFIDEKYWHDIDDTNNHFNYICMLYPFLLPAYFFMLRGDLMSTWSYMFVYIFIFYILRITFIFKIKNR